MFRKAAVLIIAYYVTAIALSGCCNCPAGPEYSFRWTDLNVSCGTYAIDSGKVSSPVDTFSDFRERTCVIRARLGYELIAAKMQSGADGLFNKAYACKCIDYSYRQEKATQRLQVISIYPFDATHGAMSDVTTYFRSPAHTDKGKPDGLGDLNLHLDRSYIGEAPDGIYNLYLAQKPIGGDQQFKVIVTLSDGSDISAVTPVLQF